MKPHRLLPLITFCLLLPLQAAEPPRWLKPPAPRAGDEELIFTPPGFKRPGVAAVAHGEHTARLKVVIRDIATDKPTFCRVNVVGPDGNYYQPATNHLKPWSLIGTWPKQLAGNRIGKAPIRYFGRFFYSSGEFAVTVPAGPVWIEVWKGFEYRPIRHQITAPQNHATRVELNLERAVNMADAGWHGGDSHLHFARQTAQDDENILDLMEAEDVRYAGILCYNPTSSYDARMAAQDIPQIRLGMPSLVRRGDYQIISGQEYRSGHYGHTKVFLAEQLVQAGRAYDPNIRPVFGEAVRSIRDSGGLVFWAHGGYRKEIFADYLLDAVDGVELLQFGIYRPIGLEGWYHILNTGHRLPILGASDYPACRKLADCRSYVYAKGTPRMDEWLRGLKAGRSFVTTGPLLLLNVAGQRPGAVISLDAPAKVEVNVRVRSEVAPVTHVDLLMNGVVVERLRVNATAGRGHWLELRTRLDCTEPAWIAAAAYSFARTGSPDAEAHTNPVYVELDGERPWNRNSADWLLGQLEQRIAHHRRRLTGNDRDHVLRYFNAARDRLLQSLSRP